MDVDLRLYALIDPAVAGGRTLAELATCIAGSVTLVQLRDKHGSTRAMVEEARELTVVLAPLDIPLLINDRVDVALPAMQVASSASVRPPATAGSIRA